jgi:NADP-dependent 3-hydroxy acid dehydrogenase YdfG
MTQSMNQAMNQPIALAPGAAPVALVTGVGPGTGSALARRFAAGGYRCALLARDASRIEALAASLPGAIAVPCDVADEAAVAAAYATVVETLGAPGVVLHNAVLGARGDFLTVEPRHVRRALEVNVMGLLHVARACAPAMLAAGCGSIVVTGNTAAHRGRANFAGMAPSKAAQRILAESMARRLGPEGVHVSYLTIDAVIDVPWTREAFAGRPDDFYTRPDDLAEACWTLAHQPRSAWTFEMAVRPFGETW